MPIPNPLSWLFSAAAVVLGAGAYVVVLGVMALSFPLSVIACMHLFGWTWWSAAIAMSLFG